jgi:hypothetical protein
VTRVAPGEQRKVRPPYHLRSYCTTGCGQCAGRRRALNRILSYPMSLAAASRACRWRAALIPRARGGRYLALDANTVPCRWDHISMGCAMPRVAAQLAWVTMEVAEAPRGSGGRCHGRCRRLERDFGSDGLREVPRGASGGHP